MLDLLRRPSLVLLAVAMLGLGVAGCASRAPATGKSFGGPTFAPRATIALRTPSPTPSGIAAVPTNRATTAPTQTPGTPPPATPPDASPTVASTPRPGPTATVEAGDPAPDIVGLVTPDGKPFELAALRGHPTLLFFGYTHCPDVCPETVGQLVQVLDHRPDARVVFVTVDPERDTQAWLADYLEFLPDGMTALTGSPTAILKAANRYGAHYARVDTGSASGYSMSHTAFVYLIDSEGRHVLTYPFGAAWGTIEADIDRLSS